MATSVVTSTTLAPSTTQPAVSSTTTALSTTTTTTLPSATTTTTVPDTTTTLPSTTSTTLASGSSGTTSTTQTTAPAQPQVELGSQGPAVEALQQKLQALTYQPGRTDGVFDWETRQAVIAFQKVAGLPRDGVVGPQTWSALLTATTPTPRLAASGTRVEVDLTRQVLFYIENNQVVKTLACSTGKPGWLTPPGHYHVYLKIPAWHRSSLGVLYKPCYIVGGIAIHGEGSVPAYPGSHGCIRVTVAEMDILYPQLPIGLTVDVYY